MVKISDEFVFENAFAIVREIIHNIDPYGLLKMGAPRNEFDGEIERIVRRIPECKNNRDISVVIAEVLSAAWGNECQPFSYKVEGNIIAKKMGISCDYDG